jgi:hypothetical protein
MVEAVQSSPGDDQVTVWCGNYRFAREDPFLARAVKTGRTYVDPYVRGSPVSAEHFRAEMQALRKMAPADGRVLLDELEHRWANHQAPPALYVLTCEVCVPDRCELVAGEEEFGQAALSTKVGKAGRSLAPRIVRYAEEGIKGVEIAKGSLALRVVIYGRGPAMMSERELKQVATKNATLLERVDEVGRRRAVTTESYAGVAIIKAVCAFARERESASGGHLEATPRDVAALEPRH